jgi:putative ABC transport system permease protein
MESLFQDIRFTLRQLRRNRGFTAVAILTFALGIGANTAIFSVVNAALLRPLPFGRPSSLVVVWGDNPAGIRRFPISAPDYFDWEEQNHCFSGMAAFSEYSMVLTGGVEPEQLDVEEVSPNFFSVLGVAPMLGRGFSKGEDRPGKSNVAVLSYGLWRSQFGGDPNAVGKAIRLNGRAVTVVGVAGPDFDFFVREHSPLDEPPQLWAPLEVQPEWHQRSKLSSWRGLRVIARMGPGISLSQARAEMNVVAANLAALYPEYDKGVGVELVSLRDQLSGPLRTPLFILLGAVGLFLLIACANLSSLLLSRAWGRRHEIAIRLALGASRSRVTRQLLMESLLVAIVGGAAGAFVAVWATQALIHVGSGDPHYVSTVTVDWRVLVFTASVALFAGLVAGLLPSFMTAGGEAASTLSGGRRTSASRQSLAARNAFVVVEVLLQLSGKHRSIPEKLFGRLCGSSSLAISPRWAFQCCAAVRSTNENCPSNRMS